MPTTLVDGKPRLIGGYNDRARKYPLHEYQEFAHDWILDRLFVQGEKGAGLFLDPGLGKTRTTLAVLDTLFTMNIIKRALIVAPLRPIYSVWPAEIEEWGFRQSHVILHDQHAQAMALDRQIELINYAGLKKIFTLKRWDIIILDESTYIKTWCAPRDSKKKKLSKPRKTPKRNRAQYVRLMLPHIPKRIILTGTPAANSLADLHSQMYVVDDGESLGRTVTQFRASFCYQGGYQGRQWMVLENRKKAIEGAIAGKVLRMQAEDYLDMPALVENKIWVDMPPADVKRYRKLKRELYADIDGGKVFAANASSAYIKCRQYASGPIFSTDEEGQKIPDPGSIAEYEYRVAHQEKIKALCDLLEELSGKPLLVLYWFKPELAELLKTRNLCRSVEDLDDDDRRHYYNLKKAKKHFEAAQMLKPPVIRGGVKPAESDRIISEWNADKHRVILCQWAAASHGLNMQKGSCSDIACFCLTESAEGYQQAIRRIYRQGQKADQVRIHQILTRGTVEEVQLERLQGKFKTEADFLQALKKYASS